MGLAIHHFPGQPWAAYPLSFRAKEVRQIANWVRTNTSGSIIGLNGSGKSDFVGFLCHRVDALQQHFPGHFPALHLLVLDLNTLPEPSLSALYRVMLRTFYEAADRFSASDYQIIQTHYEEARTSIDPFLSQSALREVLRHFQQRGEKIIFILDRFDAASNLITPEMGDSLRGLRDSFKRTLSYVTCMRFEYRYIEMEEFLGDLYRLLDGHICYLGPLTKEDAEQTICQRVSHTDREPNREEMTILLQLSGCYPALLRAVWQWWLTEEEKPALALWGPTVIEESAVQRRLDDLWRALSEEEKTLLALLAQEDPRQGRVLLGSTLIVRHQETADRLVYKGICRATAESIHIVSGLLTVYAKRMGHQSNGRIYQEEALGKIWQGERPVVDLSPKEETLLRYLLKYPYQFHTYTDLIVAVWTEDERYHGVSNDSLFQLVRGLRMKLEPLPAQPVYLVNRRGKPEGGYQLFPEGRPQ